MLWQINSISLWGEKYVLRRGVLKCSMLLCSLSRGVRLCVVVDWSEDGVGDPFVPSFPIPSFAGYEFVVSRRKF